MNAKKKEKIESSPPTKQELEITSPDTKSKDKQQIQQASDSTAENTTKRVPQAEIAEQILLGMLMLDSEAWDRLDVTLEPDDFHNLSYRIIFEAAQSLHERGSNIDQTILTEELKMKGKLEEAGGQKLIAELIANAVLAENINDYARLIHDRSLRRKFITLTNTLSASARSAKHDNVQEVLEEAEEKIFSLADRTTENQHDIIRVGDKVTDVLKDIDYYNSNPDKLTGQSTSFDELDKETAGLQDSDLIVLAGRPSMGKTSFALNIATSISVNDNQAVLFFSMEMPAKMLIMRLISILGSVNLANVRNGSLTDNNWLHIRQAGEMLEKSHIYIDDSLELTPTLIRSRIRRVMRMIPKDVELKLVVVDYIQLMHLKQVNENRVNEIAEISRSLKSTAKEFNLPVLALSQLNRSVQQRENKRPVMSDLRDSGAIEQDADLIFFIYRDEVYNQDKEENKGKAEIIIAKHRNGPTGTVHLAFKAEYASFANLSRDDYQDIHISEAVS